MNGVASLPKPGTVPTDTPTASSLFIALDPLNTPRVGGHVRVIAADRDADVAFARGHVVRRIEAHPFEARQPGFHPRVRRPVDRAGGAVVLLEQVAADVAARNAQPADERDHDVGEVLADAAPRGQRIVDRRIDARALRAVLEARVHVRHELLHGARADRRRGRGRSRRPARRAAACGAQTGSGSARPRTGRTAWRRRGAPTRPRPDRPEAVQAARHSTNASAVTVSREWRPGMLKWWTMLPS